MAKHQLADILETADVPVSGKAINTTNGWLIGWGETVPSGVAGYAPGAIFIDTDAAADAQFYLNEGSATSCSFVATTDSSLESELAAVTNGNGASKVGVEDSAAYLTAATVEAALAEIGIDLVTQVIADPGDAAAIPVTKSGNVEIVTGAGGETNTLADPTFNGQKLLLGLKTDGGGDRVVTAASPVNQTGNNTITFANAGDTLLLIAMDVGAELNWRSVMADGAALSTV